MELSIFKTSLSALFSYFKQGFLFVAVSFPGGDGSVGDSSWALLLSVSIQPAGKGILLRPWAARGCCEVPGRPIQCWGDDSTLLEVELLLFLLMLWLQIAAGDGRGAPARRVVQEEPGGR